jgi:ATP-binding cassette subfamily D (ALD) long-chain fatty acid import protein
VTGSRTLLVPHRGRVSRVQLVPIGRETYDQHRHLFPVRAETLGVNKRFWQMLFAVLKVAFPT